VHKKLSSCISIMALTLNHFSHPGCAAVRPLHPLTAKDNTFTCRACAGIFKLFHSVPGSSYHACRNDHERREGVCQTQDETPESPNRNYCTQLCENHIRENGGGFRVGDRVKLQAHYQQSGPNVTCLGHPMEGVERIGVWQVKF
jgi:hypothetical protein